MPDNLTWRKAILQAREFNLIDEPWIPVATLGRLGIADIFSGRGEALGGSPREKIALLKLLLAIAQAAATPRSREEWEALTPADLGEKCRAYLKKWHESFYLYGDAPFLQMPVEKAELKPYALIMPDVAGPSSPCLTEIHQEPALSDADRALLLVCEMSMCLGGKQPDKKVVLTPGYEKKATGCVGPGMASRGLQHAFLTGSTILETIWLNLLDEETIGSAMKWVEDGVGNPPWEKMPVGEDCETARALKKSYMGRLVPMARFCLLEKGGLRFTEGIRHPDYLAGFVDPSTAIDRDSSKPKMLWADPEKRPWRTLAAMLGFMGAQNAKHTFYCLHLDEGIKRLAKSGVSEFGIWCGGFRVTYTTGEQKASTLDDLVESEFSLDRESMNTLWYDKLKREMEDLEKQANLLYVCVNKYLKELKLDAKTRGIKQDNDPAKKATGIFWDKCEALFQPLLNACGDEDEEIEKLRGHFKKILLETYDTVCQRGTPRMLAAWAEYRPFGKAAKKHDADASPSHSG